MPFGTPLHSKWRPLAAIMILIISITTLLLQMQYIVTSQNELSGLRLRLDIRDITQSGAFDKHHAPVADNAGPTPVFMEPTDNKRNSAAPPGENELCPVHNYTAVCHVLVHVEPWNLSTRDRNIRPGYIRVNNVTVHEWKMTPNCIVVRLDLKCKRIEIIELTHENNSKWTNISQYLQTLPDRTILTGACFGKTPQLKGLVDLGIRPKFLNSLNVRKGAISFLGWTGYPGHARFKVTPQGKFVNSLSSDFYLGTPFNYTYEKATYSTTLSRHIGLTNGGHWHPGNCTPRWRIAIVVPFRRRDEHLLMFLDNMIRFLQIQKLAFSIFVIEQAGPELFNRAALMNIGYLEARRFADFDCYVFHDVDLIPEDLANVYGCSETPRHLVVTRSVTRYELRLQNYFGGGISMSPKMVERINGFPNTLFGWGGEDDNIYARVNHTGVGILRYPLEIARYFSLPHGADKGNPHMKRDVNEIYANSEIARDGLNTTQYKILAVEVRTLHTHIFVRIPGPVSRSDASHMTVV